MATASHELRNPLNGIVGMLELIERHVKENLSVHKYWQVAYNSSNLLQFLVNDLLDYSKIEAGKLTLYFERFKPAELIKETIKLLQF